MDAYTSGSCVDLLGVRVMAWLVVFVLLMLCMAGLEQLLRYSRRRKAERKREWAKRNNVWRCERASKLRAFEREYRREQ